jgi:plasmid stabilization system protein ParE
MKKKPRYEIIISDHIKHMLANHILFLSQVNPDVARQVKNALLKAISSLNEMPIRHPFLEIDNLPYNKYHKMVVGKYYLVLYQVKDQTVYVDYILDCRQDYRWLIR